MLGIEVFSFIILVIISLQLNIEARQIVHVPDTVQSLSEDVSRIVSNVDCIIDINKDQTSPAPIVTVAGNLNWLETNTKGILQINNGAWIEMYCEKSFEAPFRGRAKLRAQCVQGTSFRVNGKLTTFNTFNCTTWHTYYALRTGRTCNKGTDLLQVGYQLDDDTFLKTMDICYDEDQQATRYSYYTMHPGNSLHESGVSRPIFLAKDFYTDQNTNTLYTQARQKRTFAAILGMNSNKYFTGSSDYYLARGHLAAKADYVYAAAQRATFLFVNVAPQWQSFNGGNWQTIESSVRKYVGAENMYADIYTGVWGVSTLADVNGEQKELYLDFDSNGNGLIPVPKLYYRIVIDQNTQRGIVLLGVNNPHATLDQIERDYIICPDISDGINWVDWKKHNFKLGYCYACTVPAFLSAVDDLPAEVYSVTGVLGIDDPEYLAKFL